jgi:hypothetical protein
MKRTPHRRGATLVEMMAYVVLLLLIVTGATLALIGTLRGVTRIGDRSDRVRESARLVRRLSADLNDASFAVLPTDSSSKRSWPLLAGNSRLYISNVNSRRGGGGPEDVSTAVLATIPGRYDLTLRDSGGAPQALAGQNAPLRRTTVTGGVLIYRGKANGNPDSRNGTCLWMQRLSEDRTLAAPVLLSDKLSKDDDAVEFQIAQDGLIQAQLALQDAALSANEANPISFTLELGNYTGSAGVQATTFLGGP